MTRHIVGTQGYMVPKYIENGVVTLKLDVFALGVVMLELLSGRELQETLRMERSCYLQPSRGCSMETT